MIQEFLELGPGAVARRKPRIVGHYKRDDVWLIPCPKDVRNRSIPLPGARGPRVQLTESTSGDKSDGAKAAEQFGNDETCVLLILLQFVYDAAATAAAVDQNDGAATKKAKNYEKVIGGASVTAEVWEDIAASLAFFNDNWPYRAVNNVKTRWENISRKYKVRVLACNG